MAGFKDIIGHEQIIEHLKKERTELENFCQASACRAGKHPLASICFV